MSAVSPATRDELQFLTIVEDWSLPGSSRTAKEAGETTAQGSSGAACCSDRVIAMTHDENEFTHAYIPTGKEGAVSTLITVRHLLTGEERSVVVTPEEVIGQDWGEVVWINVVLLRVSMGHVEPENYSNDEFAIHHYLCRDSSGNRYGAFQIEHRPSGIRSETVRPDEMKRDGKNFLIVREEIMGGLKRALREAGIKPQPPPVARKKLGKPRWKDKAPKDGEQA